MSVSATAVPDETKVEVPDEAKAGIDAELQERIDVMMERTNFVVECQGREQAWDDKKLDMNNAEHKHYVQDFFMWRQYRFMRFLRQKFSKKKKDKGILKYMTMLMNAMVVVQHMQDGTHEELLTLAGKGATKLPDADNDFAKYSITTTAEEEVRRGIIDMLMKGWYALMLPMYPRIMSGDGSVWEELSKQEGEVSKFFTNMQLKARWPKFSKKLKRSTMTFAHRCMVACRIYVGEPRPEQAQVQKLLDKLKTVMGGEAETNGDFYKEFLKDGNLFGKQHLRMMDEMCAKFGGLKGARKLLKKDKRRSRKEVEEKGIQMFKMILNKMYESSDEEDEE